MGGEEEVHQPAGLLLALHHMTIPCDQPTQAEVVGTVRPGGQRGGYRVHLEHRDVQPPEIDTYPLASLRISKLAGVPKSLQNLIGIPH